MTRALDVSGKTLIIIAVTILVVLAAIAFGSSWVSMDRVAVTLLGGGERTEKIVVLGLRTPRVALAFLAGGAMALAGYLLQTVTRNSLASPGVLGVMDGAAFGVVCFLVLLDTQTASVSIHYQPLGAFIGALIAILVVFAVAGRQAQSPVRLLLFGIAVAAVAKAATLVVTIVSPIYRASQFSRWAIGAVNEANWTEVQITAIAIVPFLLLTLASARALRPVVLDETSVRGLGLNLPVLRLWIFALAAVLTAIAVCFVGAVGFVGLIAPHMARLLVGRAIIPAMIVSFLLGATMLVGADLVVRVLFAPTEIPAGTVTAVLGTPYFLFLLLRKERLDG